MSSEKSDSGPSAASSFKARISELYEKVVDDTFKVTSANPIGVGGYGGVLEAVRIRDSKKAALKFEVTADGALEHETKVMNMISGSKHFPDLLFSGLGTRPDKYIALSMEGKSLHTLLAEHNFEVPMTWAVTATALLEITRGLEALHHQGIVHKDLSLKNVITSRTPGKSQLLIIDFGLSGILDCGQWTCAIDTSELMPSYFTPYGYGLMRPGKYVEIDDYISMLYMTLIMRISALWSGDWNPETFEEVKEKIHTNVESALPDADKPLLPLFKFILSHERLDSREHSAFVKHRAIKTLIKKIDGFTPGTEIYVGEPATRRPSCHKHDSTSAKA